MRYESADPDPYPNVTDPQHCKRHFPPAAFVPDHIRCVSLDKKELFLHSLHGRKIEDEAIREAATTGQFCPTSILADIKARIECSPLPEAASAMRGVNALRQAFIRNKKKQLGNELSNQPADEILAPYCEDVKTEEDGISRGAPKAHRTPKRSVIVRAKTQKAPGRSAGTTVRSYEALMKEGIPEPLRTTSAGGPFLRLVFF
jgi:hypothetical protein